MTKQYHLQFDNGLGWRDSGISGASIILVIASAQDHRLLNPEDDMRIVSHTEGDILPESKVKLWEIEAVMKAGEPLRFPQKVLR